LPFNNTPDPRFFYSTPDHEEALASLIYAVKERKGFVLLTGEVGAGKTLVTRLMLRHFGSGIVFAAINHAVQSARDLMESVCTELELSFDPSATNVQLVRTLHDFLLAKFSQNVPVVLVLDEAQNLPIDAFEQLRMIGNLEADDAKLLQIAIVGQPELQRQFQSPQLRQLRQRLFRSFHLPALDRKSTDGYVRYRLSVAAAKNPGIFEPGAIDRVHAVSGGLPRLINTLCDNAMLSAYSSDRRMIDANFMETVIGQVMPAVSAGPTAALMSGAAVAARPVAATTPPRAPAATPAPVRPPPQRVQAPPVRPSVAPVKAAANEEAIAVHASLARLTERARETIAHAETKVRDLQRREQRIETLSGTMKTLAEQLCSILVRLQAAAAEGRRERRSCDEAAHRLETQVRESMRVAQNLAKAATRASSPFAAPRLAPSVVKSKSLDGEGIVAPTAPVTSQSIDDLQQMLRETRESLGDLRQLARREQSAAIGI
jgi:type II secretory pathway predicted ATPase ExeA